MPKQLQRALLRFLGYFGDSQCTQRQEALDFRSEKIQQDRNGHGFCLYRFRNMQCAAVPWLPRLCGQIIFGNLLIGDRDPMKSQIGATVEMASQLSLNVPVNQHAGRAKSPM